MTQIGLGGEKGRDDNAQLIVSSPYVIQPHLQKKKPSTLLMFLSILLTLCVIVLTVLGTVWLVRTHIWLSDIQNPTTTLSPSESVLGVQSIYEGDTPSIKQTMTFDEIWTLRPKGFSGQWLNEWDSSKLLYRDEDQNLVQTDYITGETSELVKNTTFTKVGATRYYPNHNGSLILLAYDEKKVWRHSFECRAKIYDVDNDNIIEFPNEESLRNDRMQFVSWAPNTDDLVFVQGNNVFYQNGPNGSPVKVTTNGGDDIFNGIPDWLYEEDVLSSARATYMSDNGKYLVFGQFDVTGIDRVQYPLYLPTEDVYASQYSAAYPIAGKTNADGTLGPTTKGSLWVYDTEPTGSPAPFEIPAPTELPGDRYFTRVAFIDNETIAVTWTNRVQNEAYIQICGINSSSANCKVNFHQQISDGWIDSPWPAPAVNLYTSENDDIVYYTYLMNNDTEGRYKHLAAINVPVGIENGKATFLTPGMHEVQGVIAYDEDNQLLYYYSTNGTQRNRHLMRMNPDSEASVKCISCDVPGCEYASAQFSANKEHFMLSCLGPAVPTYMVMNTTDLEIEEYLEDNQEFKDLIGTKRVPEPLREEIDLGNGLTGSMEYFRPVDVEQGTQHPLLVYVYGGPGSLQVTNRYQFGSSITNWLRYLGSALNIAIASVDARGTMGNGEDWKFHLYRKLGTIEIQDQISFAKAIVAKYDYINSDEVAVFGWSYGGFASSHILAQETDNTYQCALAVAPVTTQRYYDTAYTERYMGLITEDDNKERYERTDLFPLAQNFTGKKYFIAHGTHDDNVHFRNFANFVHELNKAGIQHRQQIYIDEDHSITTPEQSRHLFQAMTDFLNEDCYAEGYVPPTPPPTEPSHAAVHSSSLAVLSMALVVMFIAMF